MNISSLSSFLQTNLQPSSYNRTANTNSVAASAQTLTDDSSPQISAGAQFLSRLQQLQQTDPDQFKQLMGKIADGLQKAAQQASANGNTSEADKLNALSNQFKTASQTGQMPDLTSQQQTALAGHHHGHHGGHHHAQVASSDSTTDPSTQTDLLDALQPTTDSTDPAHT